MEQHRELHDKTGEQLRSILGDYTQLGSKSASAYWVGVIETFLLNEKSIQELYSYASKLYEVEDEFAKYRNDARRDVGEDLKENEHESNNNHRL